MCICIHKTFSFFSQGRKSRVTTTKNIFLFRSSIVLFSIECAPEIYKLKDTCPQHIVVGWKHYNYNKNSNQKKEGETHHQILLILNFEDHAT